MAENADRLAHNEYTASFCPIDLGDNNHRAGFWILDLNDGRGPVRDLAWCHRCTLPTGKRPLMLGRCDITTGTRHILHSEDPLHIEASIKCDGCGDHGYIREGRWVPA